MNITVRFSESERYDIQQDAPVVQFLATTERGSFHSEAFVDGAKTLREMRKLFKMRAIDCLQRSVPPCHISLEDYDA